MFNAQVNAVLLSISMISVSRNQCKKHFEVSKKKEPTKIFKTGKYVAVLRVYSL